MRRGGTPPAADLAEAVRLHLLRGRLDGACSPGEGDRIRARPLRGRRKRGALLTPEQAWRLAHAWYGDKLRPDWRRHTTEEPEALFRRLGLTGEFCMLR